MSRAARFELTVRIFGQDDWIQVGQEQGIGGAGSGEGTEITINSKLDGV